MNRTNNKLHTRIASVLFMIIGMVAIFTQPGFALQDPYLFAEERMQLPDSPALDDNKLEMFEDRDNDLYILNLRANTLYKTNIITKEIKEIKLNFPADSLTQDASIWVKDGEVFIKLINESIIWKFDSTGVLIHKIQLKVNNASLRNFVDLAIDPRGYIYTIEETSGKVEVFDAEGRFKGVVASIGGRYEDLRGLPQSVFIDQEGYIYVTSLLPGSNNGEIVKYSYQGMIEQRYSEIPSCLYSGTYVDRLGNVFAIDRVNGAVVKFDRRGSKICRFRVKYLRSLAVDRLGRVYLDTGQGGNLIIMLPSQTIRLIDIGNEAFLDKDWPKAERYYKMALKRDNEMRFIHLALGEVYYNQEQWLPAMEEFKLVEDHWRYSQTLAGFRLFVLLNYWPFLIFGLIIAIWGGHQIYKAFKKVSVSPWFASLSVIWAPKTTLLRQTDQPKRFQAIVTVVLFAVMNYLSWYMTNPIFVGERQVFSQEIFGWRLATAIFLILLWSWVSYKVGELFGGMAKTVSHMLAGSAVCLVPLIVFQPLLAIASHLLSYDELWVYQWANVLLWAWVGLLVMAKISLTEEFKWEKSLGISLLSVVTTVLVLCFLGFILGINQQLKSFIQDVFHEITNRLLT